MEQEVLAKANFADPDFEPTDEQLEALMTEAFAGVKTANDKALQEQPGPGLTCRQSQPTLQA